jgi:hypothetical protein
LDLTFALRTRRWQIANVKSTPLARACDGSQVDDGQPDVAVMPAMMANGCAANRIDSRQNASMTGYQDMH